MVRNLPRLKTFLLVLACLITASGSAFASPIQLLPPPADTTAENQRIVQDDYVPPNLQNISKLYWAVGKFDINDNAAIDGYLAINECDIFQKYYHNDLQWLAVRTDAKKKIMQEMALYPTRFELVIPVKLGRYDLDKHQFEVTPDTLLNAARKFDVAYNSNQAICELNNDLAGYPRNIVVLLNRPFDFKTLPVSPELADIFIKATQKQLDNVPLKYHVASYERPAYLRMKVRIVQYKDEIQVDNNGLRSLVFGRLEGFEVYADAERQMPLYKLDIKDDKIYHHARDADVTAAPALTVSTPAPAPAPVPAPAVPAAKTAIPAYQPPSEEGIENNIAAPPAAAKP